jgi:hypothetical protein
MTVSPPPNLEAESLALQLVCDTYDSTDGLPQQWRLVEESDPATTDAILYAVTRGWVLIEGGHSTCLTDDGHRLGESR